MWLLPPIQLLLKDASSYCLLNWFMAGTGQLGRKAYEGLRREDAAVRIQKYVRRHQAEQSYKKQRHAAIVLQAGARGMSARKQAKVLRREKAATIIQVRALSTQRLI
jgi:hypothetical protein